MVTHTRDGIEHATVSRGARVEHLGQVAVVIGMVALVCAVIPITCELAWLAAVPAVVLAIIALNAGAGRKRYSTAALLLGWFAFSYSFAMMLWG